MAQIIFNLNGSGKFLFAGQERRWTLLLLISVDVFTMVSTETNETDSNGRQTRRDVSADLMDAGMWCYDLKYTHVLKMQSVSLHPSNLLFYNAFSHSYLNNIHHCISQCVI